MVEIFTIVGSLGVKGGLKVKSYSNDLAVYHTVYDADLRRYQIKCVQYQNKYVVVFFDEICTRNASDQLIGKSFFIKEETLPNLLPNQYFIKDLIGQRVNIENSTEYATVVSCQNYGAGDLLELKYNKRLFLIPFTQQNFPNSTNNMLLSKIAFEGFIKGVDR